MKSCPYLGKVGIVVVVVAPVEAAGAEIAAGAIVAEAATGAPDDVEDPRIAADDACDVRARSKRRSTFSSPLLNSTPLARILTIHGNPPITTCSPSRTRRLPPGPVMIEDKKIAWPARLSIGSDGQGNSPDHIREIMSESMEALIHHFKLVTEGFRVPAGQVYAAVESPKGELGCHLVSAGGTRPYRVHFRDPSFNNLQSVAAMCEGSMISDVIAAVASIDPVMGGVDR